MMQGKLKLPKRPTQTQLVNSNCRVYEGNQVRPITLDMLYYWSAVIHLKKLQEKIQLKANIEITIMKYFSAYSSGSCSKSREVNTW